MNQLSMTGVYVHADHVLYGLPCMYLSAHAACVHMVLLLLGASQRVLLFLFAVDS